MRLRLMVISSTFVLAACVPRAGTDYPVTSKAAVAAQSNPQIVAEQDLVVEPPSWSTANVVLNARQVSASVYTVQAGDSLLSIANKTGAGATAIAQANNLTPPFVIRPGTRMQIPGGLYHRVGAGETGIAIARAYRLVWANIVALNALKPPYILQVGQNLLLPSNANMVKASRALTPEARAAAFYINIDDIVTGGSPAGTASVLPATAVNFVGRFAWPLRGNEIGVFGGLVLIDHGAGLITAYGHLSRLDVAQGARVLVGQEIGGVGETGYVSQPQLHFQVRKNRQAVNPLSYLEPSNG